MTDRFEAGLPEDFCYRLDGITEEEEDESSELNLSLCPEDEEAEGESPLRSLGSAGSVLKPFERTFTISVLKDAVNQLIIVNNGEKNVHISFDKKKPSGDRFKEPCRDNLFHARTLGKVQDVMQKMVLVKLRNDT